MSRVQGQQRQEITSCVVEPMIRTQHRWRSTHCNSIVTQSATRVEDLVTSRKTAGWQHKNKSKGKDSKGKGGKKGEGKGKGKTDKDVCLKCGQRGHWAKNCPNPAKAIHGLDGQNNANNGWWQWNDVQGWKAPSEQSTVESQHVAPTQPMAEPEAAMGGLWLASLLAGAESVQNCETSPAAELMSLEGHTAERITFGVDSGAALTVIGKDVAAEFPRVQGNPVVDGLGDRKTWL